MSTLIYSVRDEYEAQEARSRQDRRRVRWIITLVIVATGPGVFLVSRLVGAVAWRSFLTEALTLCLYAALAVWYALRHKSKRALRMALVVFLAGLVIMGLVDVSAKRGLSMALGESHRATEPRLWFGLLMLLFLPLVGMVAWRYPVEMRRIGFSYTNLEKRLVLLLLAGLSVGALIGLHSWLTSKAAGIDLQAKPWPFMAWQLFYELGPQSLTSELFMRGVVFNELFFGREWGFWPAALAISGLELLPLVGKQDYGVDLLVVGGVVFYSIVSSVASAGLFRWSRSLAPGYANNVVFGLISVLP